MTRALAVFDFGKTNSKLFVFSHDGVLLDEQRTKPVWHDYKGRSVLDDARLLDWVKRTLAEAASRFDLSGVMISAHGCAFALTRGETDLLHPVLDYEQEIPDDVAAVYDPMLPDFSESFSPHLPLGFCFARHMYWLEAKEPEAFSAAENVLGYPQFWVWRLSGKAVSEYSYLGAHSQIWAPLKRDFSSLVDRLDWRRKFPAIVAAGEIVGEMQIALLDGSTRTLAVHNGAHDSNAALAYYRMSGLSGFTLVSTGTWVIIINLDCPLEALDKDRDMISNVTVNGEPAPSLRFMGGREYDRISGEWNKPISRQVVEAVIKRGVFVMPSWAAGGPFPETEGEITGGDVEGEERAAAAVLYVVLMSDLSLDLIQSNNTLIVDGGLAKIDLYTAMLGQLRPNQKVVRSSMSEGSATGAAALALKALGLFPFKDETTEIPPGEVSGLIEYRDSWRALAEERRTKAREGAMEASK